MQIFKKLKQSKQKLTNINLRQRLRFPINIKQLKYFNSLKGYISLLVMGYPGLFQHSYILPLYHLSLK